MSIFTKINRSDLINLLELCQPFFKSQTNKLQIIDSAYEMIGLHKNKKNKNVSSSNVVKSLEQRWYSSLKFGKPDYGVYDDPGYIADIWTCWVCYSRQSIKILDHPTSLITKSVKDLIGDNGIIADLGCGFGFTTLALQEVFKQSKVFGTNLETSYQIKVARKITEKTRIEIIPSFHVLKNVNAVFASEYFEHVERPIEHLGDIVKSCHPNYFIIANGFNGTAIGHFNYYKHMKNTYTASMMSKLFLKSMRFFGYQKLESKIWNNRPSIWERVKK